MNSVNNNSNLSFQASLKVSVPVKDKVRLSEIKKLFEEKTKKYVGDTLQISKNPDEEYGINEIHHLGTGKPRKYQYPAHIMPNLNDLMAKLTDKEIVQKLVKVFKTLKVETKYDSIDSELTANIESTSKAIKQNQLYLNRCLKHNQKNYAKTYEALIENNKKRLDTLNKQQKEEEAKVAKELTKITAGDEDLEHIPSVYNMYQ